MISKENKTMTDEAFDEDAAQRILHAAALRAETARAGLTRTELIAAAAAVGVSEADLDMAISEEMARGMAEPTESESPQLPAIGTGAFLGAAGGAVAAAAGGAPFIALAALTTIALGEAGLASRLKGKLKFATFNAANVAAWGAWTVTSVVAHIDIPWSVSLAAAVSGAVLGNALLWVKNRKDG